MSHLEGFLDGFTPGLRDGLLFGKRGFFLVGLLLLGALTGLRDGLPRWRLRFDSGFSYWNR